MMNMVMRKYPVGVQTFSEIRKFNYVYIDKTDLMWKMTHTAKYIFLGRPRRFGKSLLTTTLDSYFQGEKALFEGLKIMELEEEWKRYPVIHIDLSTAKNKPSVEDLRRYLNLMMDRMARCGTFESERLPGEKLQGEIERLYQTTGEQVVVVIDEYDAPLLDILHEPEQLDAYRVVMQEFFQPLKACESMVKFCFITGITKFSQLSIFSTLNNLTNITMHPDFAAICGITEQELTTVLAPDIARLAERQECTSEEMHVRLKLQYDGYRFSEISPEVYNPFSLMKCMLMGKMDNYWFESGTPAFLIRQMRHFRTDITSLDNIEVPSTAFDKPTEAMTTALPLLYQSGYLTIKDYDRESGIYRLSIPNKEVRVGYVEGLLPTYIGLDGSEVQTGFALKFWRALKKNDIDLAMQEMKAYFAGLPYVEGFKKKLEEVKNYEGFYEWSMYLVLSMLNVYVRTQVKCAGGRTDMVVWMPDTTYVFELKVGGTAQEALSQIDSKDYALPYSTEGRNVVKAGVVFDTDKLTIKDWLVD